MTHETETETPSKRLARMVADLDRLQKALLQCRDLDDLPRLKRAVVDRTAGIQLMRDLVARHNLN